MSSERRARTRLSQLRLYVNNHINDKYLAPPMTLVVAVLLTVWVPPWQAALWAVVELAVIAAYIAVYHRFLAADPQPEEEPAWAGRIALAHGAHMVAWSSIVVWAWQPGNFDSLMFVMLIHVGLISLTAAMSNPHRRLLLNDLLPPTLALAAPPLLGGGWLGLGLSLLALLYIALMLVVSLRIHASNTEALLLRQRNEGLIRELELRATRDPLTGVANRSHLLALGESQMRRAAQERRPLALLMVDIDHFKPINDSHGHLVGDDVLTAMASGCADMLREEDVFGRLGGEEFAVILPDTGLEAARATAERIRKRVAGLRVPVPGALVGLTVSIGVTLQQAGDQAFSALLRRADRAMYAAKAGGRNRVVVYEVVNHTDRVNPPDADADDLAMQSP